MTGVLLVVLLLVYGLTGLSLNLTRRISDQAYFRRRLAHGRLPWIAHIPTYGLMVYGTLYLVGAFTGFPYTLDPETFLARNAYGIWSLAMAVSQVLSGLALFSVVGVPVLLWLFTQRIPERGAGRTRGSDRQGNRRRRRARKNRPAIDPPPPGDTHG